MKQISAQKMPKKKQRELARQMRGSWGIHPATRVPPAPKAYHRQREKVQTMRQLNRES